MVIADSLESCEAKLKAWKLGVECKSLCINTKKMKFLVSHIDLDILKDSGKYLTVCHLLLWLWSQLHLVLPVQAVGAQEVQQHYGAPESRSKLCLPTLPRPGSHH